jgi:hypothetical protein
VTFEEDDLRRSPWYYQPDPRSSRFVCARAIKLVRRSPREYFMVGERSDGRRVEVRLTSGTFHMEGLF